MICCLLISMFACAFSVAAEEAEDVPVTDEPAVETPSTVVESYDAYRVKYDTVSFGKQSITLLPTDVVGGELGTAAGRDQVLIMDVDDQASWTVDVPVDSRYIMEIVYCALPGRGIDCQIGVSIDEAAPFLEAKNIAFSRVWKDLGDAEVDSNGNHVRPEQEEVLQWQTRQARDNNGYTNEEFRFHFAAGQHTFTLTMVNESMAIAEVRLIPVAGRPSYEEYKGSISESEIRKEGLSVTEAETPLHKSHSMIYATTDNSSPATSPSHPTKIRLNTLGQSNWKYSGQWVTWTVDVPEAGYYHLSFKYRQDFVRGLQAARRLYINDEIPFAEAECLYFPYNMGFENITLGNGEEEYLFYFKKGQNTVTLEVVLGDISEVLVDVNNIVAELNDMYRQIIMITGPSA